MNNGGTINFHGTTMIKLHVLSLCVSNCEQNRLECHPKLYPPSTALQSCYWCRSVDELLPSSRSHVFPWSMNDIEQES